MDLCSFSCIQSTTHTYTYAHTLPSFKEGKRVNVTPVKYHGGRNYKSTTAGKTIDPRKIQPKYHRQRALLKTMRTQSGRRMHD